MVLRAKSIPEPTRPELHPVEALITEREATPGLMLPTNAMTPMIPGRFSCVRRHPKIPTKHNRKTKRNALSCYEDTRTSMMRSRSR